MSGPDLIDRLALAAEGLVAQLAATPGAEPLPAPDMLAQARAAGTLRRPLTWRNTIFATPQWRRAHVELFVLPGELGVLHLCAFPWLDAALPILGFDVILGREKATGCFLDLSPTVPDAAPLIADWAALRGAVPGLPRALPDWAAVFSPQAVAVRPRDAAEVAAGLALGAATLAWLLATPPACNPDRAAMRAAQACYVAAQRRNQHTRRMLANCVGEPLAETFIAECLFPEPPADRLAAAA